MARKIKLPLDMGNDIKVRDIDELKENYNSEKVVESFLNGELLPWLQDRFYEEEAERVESLSADRDSGNIAGKLADIFGVQIESEVDVDEIAERNERLAKLRSITSDDEVLRNVDLVAFSQEDMDIVYESDVIYLCGDKFRIPYNVKNKRYIGVNEPLVEIKAEGEIDLESREIVIEKCRFAEGMRIKQPPVAKQPQKEETQVSSFANADGIFGEIGRYYSPKGAKGDPNLFERLDFNDKYIQEMKIGVSDHEYEHQTLELKYENKHIYISGKPTIYGKVSMRFENCVIHVGASKALITLRTKFNAMFSRCTFIFDKCGIYGHSYNNDEKCLFKTNYRDDNQNMSFKDCLFIHSNCLVHTGLGSEHDLRLLTVLFKNCHFINCYDNIVCGYANSEVSVNNCAISQDGRGLSFYNDEYIAELVHSDPITQVAHTIGGVMMLSSLGVPSGLPGLTDGRTKTEKFINNLSNLVMFRKCTTAKKNLIMLPKNLKYLKRTVGEDWEMYGVDLDSYDLNNQRIKPRVFPWTECGEKEKGGVNADPSDRETLDKFFNGELLSNTDDMPKNISNGYQQHQSGDNFGFDLCEIEKKAKQIETWKK